MIRKGSTMSREEFRRIISDLGLTQAQVAEKLNINERTVRRYAGGASIPQVVKYSMYWLKSQKG